MLFGFLVARPALTQLDYHFHVPGRQWRDLHEKHWLTMSLWPVAELLL
ncbi:hypothetical protein [Mumia zhuanghuii]|nr:hypothetical protein [Mumia zhuanghuii]